MSKTKKRILVLFIALILILIGIYFGLTYYYSHPSSYMDENGNLCKVDPTEKCFYYGITVNDQYATGKTVKQINESLANSYDQEKISFQIEGKSFSLDLKSIDYRYDYTNSLNEIIEAQNPYLWYETVFGEQKYYTVNPVGTFNDELFEIEFAKLDFKNLISSKQDLYIEFTDEDGYQLVNGKEKSLNTDMVKATLKDKLKNCEFELLITEDYFTVYEYSKEEKQLMDLYSKIDEFQSREIAYKFGKETRKVSKSELATLLNTGEVRKRLNPGMNPDNYFSFTVDEDRLVEFITDLLDPYNTLNNRHFITHSGAEVLVKKGNYGNKIDMDEEIKEFVEFFNSDRKRYTRTPKYLAEKAKYKELNDFGDTFIEISIDEQRMWYYVDGEVYVETDITSGSRANGGTAPRVVYVYNKIPGKWLNGPTWHSWVDFWVPIEGAIGIHDASWRKVYGGTEYIYNGSHGCVNTPREAMEKLYDRVEIGTPVIVYSIEKNGVNNEDSKKK